ncbi:MAG: isoprenoid biosynthesis glyoxalase ElbB [Bdellovibrionales bacterium]
MKKIAVILSGCGYLDGSEVTEATSLFIEFSRNDISYDVYAPNQSARPTPHFDGGLLEPAPRNCMEESARITRGNIRDLNELNPSRYDGLALPGGYGVAKNLSTWAMDGHKCSVNRKFKDVVLNFFSNSKPILAICISPAIVAKILSDETEPTLTIGNDPETIAEIEKTGAEHVKCSVTDFVSDRESKIISTPAYMYNAKPHEVFEGIQKASAEFLEMC